MAAPASGRAASQYGGLTDADKKHWAPNPDVVNSLVERLKGKKVLEIGPGHVPFPAATEFVDWDAKGDLPGPCKKVDLNCRPLPYADKSFEFVYCRHVLEDMYDPFPLMEEMSRVGHAGYVETPSPLAEMGRGVDGGSPPYRGYHHHRWVIWKENKALQFVSKYPMVEYLPLDDQMIADKLRADPVNWNTFYVWRDRIGYNHLQNPIDYYMPTDYVKVINRAICG